MLSRPATKVSLTADDILAYDQRKQIRDQMKQQQQAGGGGGKLYGVEETPTGQHGKSKATKEQRIGIGSSRS